MHLSNWIEAFTGFATLGAVLVALFRERILARWHPPRLSISVASELGELIDPIGLTVNGATHRGAALYFHVRVANPRRYFPVRSVQVALLGVELKGPDGRYRAAWSGDFPLPWRHVPTSGGRTFGTPYDADLCFLTFGHGLVLEPSKAHPSNFPGRFASLVDVRLTVQARGEECDSSTLTVEISWDGAYGAHPKELHQHISVRAEQPWYFGRPRAFE
jgi:hypothetical protein